MRDMFDEFLKELAERQREAERRRGSGQAAPNEPIEKDEEGPLEGEQTEGAADEPPAEARAAADEGPAPEEGEEAAGGPEEPEQASPEPRPIFGRGGRPPRRPAATGDRPAGRGRRRIGTQVLVAVVVLLLLAILLLLGSGIDLVTDAIWFDSVGYDSVFWTRLAYQVVLFLAGTGIVLAILLFNLWLAGRLAPPPVEGGTDRVRGLFGRLGEAARGVEISPAARDVFGGRYTRGPGEARMPQIEFETPELPDLSPLAIIALALIATLAALGVGTTLAGSWETIALWQNQVSFSPDGAVVADPVFGRDISYYLFELPFLRLVQATAGAVLIASLVVAGGRYLAAAARGSIGLPTPVRVHLGVLGGLFLLTVAVGYQLDKLELVYSVHDFGQSVGFVGVSYTDQAARFFALDAMTIVAGLVAALLVGAAFTRWLWPVGAGIVVWIGLSLLLGGLYPEVIQRFTVDPNEFAQEQPYIGNNIRMTRLAFDLDTWENRSYQGDAPLTAEALKDEAATFQNARLWDYRPLQVTLDQLQTVRQYYDFFDVDTDRYLIDEDTRQVMLSGRELAPEKNPQADSWVNQRIVFTHGFGLAMVPVNEVDDQGLPKLIIKDLPPVASSGAPEVTEPRIYFGERRSEWVLVGAKQPEFDYPTGGQQVDDGTANVGQDAQTRWTGTTGIRVDSLLTRLLFAARFRDLNLLITDQVTSDSQILVNRSLQTRLQSIAPFLVYDKDPYLVVNDSGRLVYIQDAYTVTDRFPNAQWFDSGELGQASGFAGRPVNYVRNSVKIVMDAYDGTMTFYVADPDDPLIRAWQRVFPDVFRPLADMPAALQPHLRVPEEQFNVQTRMFARYHVTDESTFYQNNDLWMVPQNAVSSDTGQLPLEAYYVYMRMPGEPEPEFLLLQPMVPQLRPNMIAWVAARNDQPNYGGVRVYRFPRDTSVFGPVQIEARIDQDPQISSQLTLWSQAGSNVIRGNLIVVPVQDSIIYLEPIYLQSTGSAIPEFTRIVVASPTTVVWGRTLEEALYLLLGEQPGPSPSPSTEPTPGPSATPGPTATPGGSPLPADVDALVRYANEHFELAQAALRAGDFARYGEEIEKVREALAQLEVLIGPTPAP
ncbi:MAG: hypothetical protein H6Q36_1047 [Chloroflexi bacterium]|nr:hypothetical protein [Chloroflexota bacterium]